MQPEQGSYEDVGRNFDAMTRPHDPGALARMQIVLRNVYLMHERLRETQKSSTARLLSANHTLHEARQLLGRPVGRSRF